MSKMTTKAFLARVEMKLSAAKMENMFIRYAAGGGVAVAGGPTGQTNTQENTEDNRVK